MSDDALKYDRMVETALRGVVREALTQVAQRGLPGNHHFYITFRTDHPAVSLADALRERFPAEMTIVLQHQFWGLKVEHEGFEVTLSFSDKPERLVVPFAAVTSFADPSVRFGLQFEAGPEGAGAEGPGAEPGDDKAKPSGTAPAPLTLETAADKRETSADTPKPAEKSREGRGQMPAAASGPGQGKAAGQKKPDKAEPADVVSLDAFRKK